MPILLVCAVSSESSAKMRCGPTHIAQLKISDSVMSAPPTTITLAGLNCARNITSSRISLCILQAETNSFHCGLLTVFLGIHSISRTVIFCSAIINNASCTENSDIIFSFAISTHLFSTYKRAVTQTQTQTQTKTDYMKY